MASYFDEIARNRRKTILLFILFALFFFAVTFAAVWLLGGGLLGLIVGFVIVLVLSLIYYAYAEKLVLAVSKAQPADKAKYQQLYDIEGGLSSAAQVPMPRMYVINDPNPNAFAAGKRKNPSISVTTGLLNTMDREELEGVLAHETSHIADNDIQYMMVALVFAGVIGIVAAFIRNIVWFGGFRRIGGQGAAIAIVVAIVFSLVAWLFAMLIRMAISRSRESLADANGARMTRNPASLVSALQKIQKYDANPRATSVQHATEVTASLYFSNPFTSKSLLNIFSTHPPIEERIKKLQQMY